MFNLCRNQVVGFYYQNVWKTPVEEWHFSSKNQLPGLSIVGTLVENGLKRHLQDKFASFFFCKFRLYLLKSTRTYTTKTKTKKLKVLKDNKFIDNKLYCYLKPTDSPVPSFYGQPKIHKPGVSIRPFVSYTGSPLNNLNKYIANISKMKITTPRILPRFPATSEMFPLKMMR